MVLQAGAFCQADENAIAVLREINLARTQPREYAKLLATEKPNFQGRDGGRALCEAVNFLNHTRPLPPLSFSNALAMGAMSHVLNQGLSGSVGHQGRNRRSPWDRMHQFGQWIGSAGENISYGIGSPRGIVMSLIIDEGVGDRGHRKNIFYSKFGVAGVACGPHSRFGTMCVMDFAGGFIPQKTISCDSDARQISPNGNRI